MHTTNPTIHPRLALALLVILTLFSHVPAQASPQIEWKAPGFEIAEPDGTIFQYPGNLENPTIILFWATWCPYCKSLMPHLQSIIDEYRGQVQVLAFNFKDDDDPATYISDRGYDFKLILNSEQVAESWGVKGTPGLFLADPTGRVVFSHRAIPAEAYTQDPSEDTGQLKHYQKAARVAPFWAAQLRIAIDQLLEE